MTLDTRIRRLILATAALLLTAVGGLAPTLPVRAATLTVDTLQDLAAPGRDPSPCSLRQAIARAAAGDTIQFSVVGVITLTRGQLTINRNVSIQGPGPTSLTIDGMNASRVFLVSAPTVPAAVIAGLTIQGGRAPSNDGIGGGGAIAIGNFGATVAVS